MSYSIMFKVNLYSDQECCAVSGIEEMYDAYKLKTWFENNPYDSNIYWVRTETVETEEN